MKQPTDNSMNGVVTTSEKLAEGSALYALLLGMAHGTAAFLLADRQAAVTGRKNHEDAKDLMRSLRLDLDATRFASRGLSMLMRDNLKPILGTEFNSRWGVVGYDGSLETAFSVDDLILQMEAFGAYFGANPAHEIASKDVTAAKAHEMRAALIAGRQAVNDQEAKVGQSMELRDAKFELLRKRIRLTIDELHEFLPPLDPRWKSFGLNMPGADETPDVPTNIFAILIGPNAAALKWNAAPRASYYRVWKRVLGVDAEPVAVGSPADVDFTMENLPANATIEIYVSAVNNGGESQLSEKVTITTH
ncbi:MAG: hypothetical protein JWM68_5528 [Verrucomicrobiales bacterium]|nr:hypothetical protein [Verrucomicrobiales bacterium]